MNGLTTQSPGGEGQASGSEEPMARRGEGEMMFVHPSPSRRLSEPEATLILPHQGGGKFFRELDPPATLLRGTSLFVGDKTRYGNR